VTLSLGNNIVRDRSTPNKNLPKPARKQCSGEKGSWDRGFKLTTIFEEPQFEGSQFEGSQPHTKFERLGDSFAFKKMLKITNLKDIASIVEQAKAKANERQKPFCGA